MTKQETDQTAPEFKLLFEHSPLGMAICNQKGVILQANPYFYKIFEYPPESLTGQKVEVLIPEPLRKGHIDYRNGYMNAPSNRAMGEGRELKARKENGELFYVEVSLSFFHQNDDLRIICIVNDISQTVKLKNEIQEQKESLEKQVIERTSELNDAFAEIKKTNTALEAEIEKRKFDQKQVSIALERERELNLLKSRFVSMASHEFRTPLAGVLTSTSLINRYTEKYENKNIEKHIKSIKRSVRFLTSILNEFLSLDKFEQGKIQIIPRRFDITHFFNEILEDMREGYSGEIKFQLIGSNLSFFQDPDLVKTIVNNLLSNAIKYSPNHLPIIVKLEQNENRSIELEIIDQGIGIPEDEQKHLFDRFFRANNVESIQGTGLGLNITKEILSLLGGTIRFTSQYKKGTSFFVTIPEVNNE
jgi:PAS domain S-box-containing protein